MKKLLNLEDLTQKEAYELFAKFSEYSREKQSAILALLRVKKETIEEILGAIEYFRQYSTNITHNLEVVDIVGTGGDATGTFNISTAASLVVASCGVLVTKHGGKSVTSKSGSQDVAQALGIKILENGKEALRKLHETNYTYLWAPLFNGELKKYGSLRKNIGFPTIFNIIGPLLNPMQPKRCVIGVYRRDLMHKVAELLKIQKINHALVVNSDDGLDEISISDKTRVVEIKHGDVKEYDITPEYLGLARANLSQVKGGDAIENAKIINNIFSGEINGAKLDVVLLNAAAGLYVAGKVNNLLDGVLLAKDIIKQGRATALLNKIRVL